MSERDAIVAVTEADREAAERLEETEWSPDIAWSHIVAEHFARHRATHAGEVERLREENEALKKRGAELVIVYHVAICLPKGVVPDDRFYDPAIAAKIQAELKRARQTLEASR